MRGLDRAARSMDRPCSIGPEFSAGDHMAERSWFVASGGKQEGPHSETVFRGLIGQGQVTPDTLVWTEGMAEWQRAGDIPGLFSAAARPPAFPGSGLPQSSGSDLES